MNKFQEFTEDELRDKINGLIEKHGEGTYAVDILHKLAEKLDIQLKPKTLEFDATVFGGCDSYALTFQDDNGFSIPVCNMMRDIFDGSWEGNKVTVTIKEYVGEYDIRW